MNPDEIIKKKKVDMNIIENTCIGKEGYIVYNALMKKEKRKLTKEEYLVLKGYKRP